MGHRTRASGREGGLWIVFLLLVLGLALISIGAASSIRTTSWAGRHRAGRLAWMAADATVKATLAGLASQDTTAHWLLHPGEADLVVAPAAREFVCRHLPVALSDVRVHSLGQKAVTRVAGGPAHWGLVEVRVVATVPDRLGTRRITMKSTWLWSLAGWNLDRAARFAVQNSTWEAEG